MEHYLGVVIAVSSWGFLFLGQYTLTFEMIPKWFTASGLISPWGYFWIIIFQIFFFSALISHARSALMEPGYTPKFPVPGDIPLEKIRYCEICDQWKPDRTHHCRMCKRCIHRMDHHCPWINNCVGAKNQKFFMCFLFYVFLCCLEVCALMVYIIYSYFLLKDRSFRGGLVSLLIGVFTGIIASVFLIFTVVMFYDQVEVIVTNQTEVEKLSNMAGKEKTFMESMKESLGSNVLSWLNPLVDSPDPNYAEMLFNISDKLKFQ